MRHQFGHSATNLYQFVFDTGSRLQWLFSARVLLRLWAYFGRGGCECGGECQSEYARDLRKPTHHFQRCFQSWYKCLQPILRFIIWKILDHKSKFGLHNSGYIRKSERLVTQYPKRIRLDIMVQRFGIFARHLDGSRQLSSRVAFRERLWDGFGGLQHLCGGGYSSQFHPASGHSLRTGANFTEQQLEHPRM